MRAPGWAVSVSFLLAACSPRDRYIERSVTRAEVVGDWVPAKAVGAETISQDQIIEGLQRLVLLDEGSCRVLTPSNQHGDDAPTRAVGASGRPSCRWELGVAEYVPVEALPNEPVLVPAVRVRISHGGWNSGEISLYLDEEHDTLVLWHKGKDAYYSDAVILTKRSLPRDWWNRPAGD